MITKFKIFEFKTMEKNLKDLENRQKILYAKLQASKNKEESDMVQDEIIINSRLIDNLTKRKETDK